LFLFWNLFSYIENSWFNVERISKN
jgi:hypothetical protein